MRHTREGRFNAAKPLSLSHNGVGLETHETVVLLSPDGRYELTLLESCR